MEMTQTVSTITEVPVNVVTTGTAEEPLTLATVWAELKVERVQDGFVAGAAEAVSLSLRMAVHQSQTVAFDLSGPRLAITFNHGDAASAA